MSVFVNISGKGPVYDNDAQRQIRSQAMKDFRQRQREAERQRWKNSIKAPASLSRDLGKDQSTPADRSGQETGDIEVQTPARVSADDEAPKADHTSSTCVKQFSMPRFIPIPSKPVNANRSGRRKAGPTIREHVSRDPSIDVQAYERYLTKDVGSTVRSPQANRQQLVLTLIDLHYSGAMPKLHLAFTKIHTRLKPLRTGVQTAATDAVLLQSLAISSKDDSLMWAAKRKNNEAIARLRSLLSSPRDRDLDEMLLTTDALAFFDAGSTHWRKHVNGLSALITARGTKIYDTFAFMLHPLVLQLLGDALLWRKPFMFGEARWLSAMLPTCQTRMNRLAYLGCHVPNIANQTDQYLSELQQSKSVYDLLIDSIDSLERSLQEWLSDWYLNEFQDRPPYTMITKSVRLDVGLSASLDTLLLGGHYSFPSLREAFGHNCFWTLLLQLRQARYKLHASSSTTIPAASVAEQTAASEVADSICRSAPFILRAVSDLPSGLACSAGPLILAGRWYKACGKSELADWCFGASDMLTANGTQPPGWVTRCCAAWVTAAL